MTASRRRVLAGLCLPVAASLGGCLRIVGSIGEGNGPNGTNSSLDGNGLIGGPGNGIGEESGNGSGGGVTVHDVTVQPEVVAFDSPDSYGVYGDRGDQYVIADVEVSDPEPFPVDEFAIETPNGTYPATIEIGTNPESMADDGDPYGWPDSDPAARGWLAVSVPKPLSGAADARLAWADGEHALATEAVDRLTRPSTDFEVSLKGPESVTIGETVTARVTISNVGDVDGTFVAAINRQGPQIASAPEEAIAVAVPAGEVSVRKFEFPVTDPEIANREAPSMRLHLQWRDGERTRETTIVTDDAT
ncbi:hypothetical protein ACERIT_04675 [Halopenitus sp. H-Gu1]|uniref:hypothetical protein n=1 Tax=Halopenitus sp. H-Gu1 TaxID=3242697 RepID=UPI00359CC7A1